MFTTLSDRLTAALNTLRGQGRLTEADVTAACRQIRIALLEADVALPVAKTFVAAVKERALGEEVSGALNPSEQVVKIVYEELTALLGGQTRPLAVAEGRPTVVMLAGLQGAGKTTLASKLARRHAGQGGRPLLVAADLQRPGAVTQLRLNAERAGVDVFAPEPGDGVGDPVTVATAGLVQARAGGYDLVVVDTAGRLSVDASMLEQAAAIETAVEPDEVLLVVDAMTGQDAANTANAFAETVGLTGVVLTKLDGDTRGGAALSLVSLTGRPVLFASTGEKLDDLEVFHPDRMASRILDMGDVLTLIEKAERTFADEEAAAAKLATGGTFTLEDFRAQMRQIRNMGSLTKLLGMLPGMGALRAQLENVDDRDLDRVEAIIGSMTAAERATPEIVDDSRRARIAAGSGRRPEDVAVLIDRFYEARNMMTAFASGSGPAVMPSMPGLGDLAADLPTRRPGAAVVRQGKQKKGGRRVSGNPAKRR